MDHTNLTGFVRQLDLDTRKCRIRLDDSSESPVLFETTCSSDALPELKAGFRTGQPVSFRLADNQIVWAGLHRQ